jgi:hypothetical protein
MADLRVPKPLPAIASLLRRPFMNTRKTSRAFCFVLAFTAFTFSLAVRAQAQTETTLFTFTGPTTGENPSSGLIFDAAGNLYGVTPVGGKTSRTCKNTLGCGMVFELSPSSSGGYTETILYTFTGAPDGQEPTGSLVFDAAGNLYGVTNSGGDKTKACWDAFGCGVVFRLSPGTGGTWIETILYTFTNGADGASPVGPLVLDSAGNLYGTTLYGGNPACGSLACGVLYELSPSTSGSWIETVLHSFTGGNDGDHPQGAVTFDAAGKLYGSAQGGNPALCGPSGSCGLVFKLTPGSGGWNETVLHNFSGGRDGGSPNSSLVFDGAGNLYGTTVTGGNSSCAVGGDSNNCGVVFKLTPAAGGPWAETSMPLGYWDGAQPAPGLLLDTSGNIYGTATSGGISTDCVAGFSCGTVFKFTPNSSGNSTPGVLYRFTGGLDGGTPFFAPIADAAGNLYVTTGLYGADGFGTVVEITP